MGSGEKKVNAYHYETKFEERYNINQEIDCVI